MSVFTKITQTELEQFIQRFDVGELTTFSGIDAGIDNTNYFVDTCKNNQDLHFVLTLFETISFDEVDFPLQLMSHLSNNSVPCATPISDTNGQFRHRLKNKPCVLVTRLKGADITTPDVNACQQAAQMLGQFHLAGQTFSMQRNNPMGMQRWLEMEQSLANCLSKDELELIRSEINHIQGLNFDSMPTGSIHADLFRDNILFSDNKISGVIDLYFACTDLLLYDLAITINDWSLEENQRINADKAKAMLKAYHQQRKLNDAEKKHWPSILRMAALRFWLSRLYDMHFPRPGDLTHCKNPDHMKALLNNLKSDQAFLNSLWPES